MTATIEYVVGFYFRDHEVLLIRKTKPDWMKGMYNGVGGIKEDWEAGDEAMSREFKEETGLALREDRWEYFAAARVNNAVVYCYRADALKGDGEPKSVTEETVGWVSRYWTGSRAYGDGFFPDVAWLIPMADLRNRRAWPYEIEKKGDELER